MLFSIIGKNENSKKLNLRRNKLCELITIKIKNEISEES